MRLAFLGTPEFAIPSLQALAASHHEILLVVTGEDKKQKRGLEILSPPLKIEAEALKLPIIQCTSLKKGAQVYQLLETLHPDCLIVAAFGLIIPSRFLEPPFLSINIHPSLLPRHRGASPIQTAILWGDKITGVSIIRLTEKLDAGPIFGQCLVEIGEYDTGELLSHKLAQNSVSLLLKVLDQIENGIALSVPQTEEEATYAPKLSKEMGHVDWNEVCDVILRKIRGLQPWPAAYTFLHQQRLKIFQAEKSSIAASPEKPGTIISTEGSLFVQAKDGVIRLTEVQLANRKRLKALEFLRGYPLRVPLQLT